MTPEQIKAFIAEREAERKVLAERIDQLDREIHDLRCRLVGVKMNNPPGKNGKEPGVKKTNISKLREAARTVELRYYLKES